MLDKNRPYSRLEIDKVFTKVKATMHAKALLRGKERGINKAFYIDLYTGKELLGGDPYDYEHIRSSEAIFNEYKGVLNDEQIALVVNCNENVGVTLSSLNKSKGKRKMEDWLENPKNIVTYNVDMTLTKANLKKADKGIERKIKEFNKLNEKI
tara:strand:- start:4482 stop:4940 length:459 start_codon:yes stop_codon:yes gene_type:complete